MNPEAVVRLLEGNWQDIQEHLGGDWPKFLGAFRGIVDGLPSDPSAEDAKHLADSVCQLMGDREFTRGLLRQALGADRAAPSAASSLPDQLEVQQICNRFRQLAHEGEEEAPPEGEPVGKS